MKSKTLNTIIGVVIFVLGFAVWKLNDYYKQEKSVLSENLIHQQTLNLKTSISSQLNQLKNVISSYQGQIDESKINWVQINPFYALVQVEISAQGQYTIKNLFVKSSTPAENWSKDYIQKAFSYSRFSNKEIHGQLFQNQAGEKFLTLLFSDEKIQNTRRAVAVVGEATYFQKYFDLQRGSKATNLLLTHDSVVVGHTQSDYIATKTQEESLNAKKFFLEKDQIRSSNLSVLSYSPKLARGEFLFIPVFVLVFVFGFSFLLLGILLYALKPMQNENRKAEIFKKVFEELRPVVTAAPPLAVPLLEEKTEEIALPLSSISELAPELEVSVTRGIERIKLSEVVELALTSLTKKIKDNDVYIEKHFESDRIYDVDVERFRKAIDNMLINSIEAQAKEIIIKIYDIPGVRGMVTNIDIIDDGQGIDANSAEKIWQPFFGTKDKIQHKGLGLPETLSVARRYGADVKLIENQIGGTTLRIEMDADNRLPTMKITPATIPLSESTSEAPAMPDSLDIDIDAILSLDDHVENEAAAQLEKEFTTTQFKIDRRIEILEEPKIDFSKPEKQIDHFEVKVRRPGENMNVNDIAQDFNIAIFSQNVELGVDLKLNLKNKNYQVELFSNHDDLIHQFDQAPSHIVIVDIATLILPVHEFFEKLLKISNEVRMFILCPPDNMTSFNKYASYNLYGVFSQADSQCVQYVCNACDLVAEALYRLYQNEHVLALYEVEKKQHAAVLSTLEKERSSTQVRPYQIRIAEYRSCQSKEELLDVFYNQTSSQSWIYLKYIPTIETFISVSNHEVPESWVEGLSFKVPATAKNFRDQIFQGALPAVFEEYLLEKFGVNQIKFIPLIVKNQIEGLMISPQDISAASAEDFSLMSLVYANLMYEAQPKYLDVEDQLTGFYNQLFYRRALDKEIDRSKRTMKPLSVVKLSIDKFMEIETTLGKVATDEIIKKIAELIKQTSRLPDYICRTADNEFSLALVNCDRKGAVIRSERLREALNKENYAMMGIRISVSQGISEYPTLVSTADQLDESAAKALKFISNKGGDKICLSKANPEHQPDFYVEEMVSE